MRLAKPADQFGIAEAPAIIADDCCAFGDRNGFGEGDQAEIGGGLERGVACLRPFTQQVEQLTELSLRRTLAGGAMAQHCGKAVVEMHSVSEVGHKSAQSAMPAGHLPRDNGYSYPPIYLQ